MFNKLKQFIPSSWKNKLRRRFQFEIAKTGNFDHAALAAKIAELEKNVFDLQPEIIHCSPLIKQTILQQWKDPEIAMPGNILISKHDYMYQFLKTFFADADRAYVEYIISGAHMMKVLKDIVVSTGRRFSNIHAFLDFASGYGRLTRYVVELIDPTQIWISDIKQGAVDFQAQQFGVHGILSVEDPAACSILQQFDIIFVGSLFSHLPDETFGKWLKYLYSLLSGDGLLIFTVHDKSLDKNVLLAKEDIVFLPVSEEINLISKDGKLPGDQYGTTYVNEIYVDKQIKNLQPRPSKYKRLIKTMWSWQDVYILSKNAEEDLSGISL